MSPITPGGVAGSFFSGFSATIASVVTAGPRKRFLTGPIPAQPSCDRARADSRTRATWTASRFAPSRI